VCTSVSGMADELRTCRRTGCRWPAAASLSYRYATSQVWLLDLSPEPDPSLYDLCPHHADHTTVPRGWERVDQRTIPEVVVEPAGNDLVIERSDSRPLVGAMAGSSSGRSRYEALAEDLPRLAAQWSADPHAGHADELPPHDATVTDPAVTEAPRRLLARPSRDLAPMPAGEVAAREQDEPAPADTARQLDGQLAMPGLVPAEPDTVVVSIELAGRRRAEQE
jgi:hypothetical protein